jgi:hypothetical protein
MTREICPLPDEDFHESARAILVQDSEFLREAASLSGAGLWRGGVNQKSKHTAYWIGDRETICAFLIVTPFTLPGVCGQEAVRGWTHPNAQGKGCFRELMAVAAGQAPLVADREGMTAKAHAIWLDAAGFSRSYYDQHKMVNVAVEDVPEGERFTKEPAGTRWLLVLTPTLPDPRAQ